MQQTPPISDKNRWSKELHGSTRHFRLKQRQEAIRAIREDFYSNDFLEVETPILIKGTCPDLHIDSFQVGEGYLATSTEYQIKRLIVGGLKRVFTLTKNFRAHDRGRYHSHEFTMLEWARAHETLNAIEEDAIRFIQKAFTKLYPQADYLEFNGHRIQFTKAPWQRLTVKEAFKTYLNLEDLNDFSLKALHISCDKAHLPLPEAFKEDRYAILSWLFDRLQPHLGISTPVFLYDWPAFLTTSAPICPHDPSTTERTELYIGGIEIADGFPFLRDVQLQTQLFEEELEKRKSIFKEMVKIDDRYLEALKEGLPAGAGMALGVDRLIMVLTCAECLADVQAFDWDEL